MKTASNMKMIPKMETSPKGRRLEFEDKNALAMNNLGLDVLVSLS